MFAILVSIMYIEEKKKLISSPYVQNNACIYFINPPLCLVTNIKTSSLKKARGALLACRPLISIKLQLVIDGYSTLL
jgi:hypothetical protein